MTTTTFSKLLGIDVSTHSNEWRHECEIIWCLTLSQEKRREYLDNVEKKRGKPAADTLRLDGAKMININRRS